MRKEGGWIWYRSISLALSSSESSRWNLQNLCRPHPVRGLKLLSVTCICHLKSIFVSQQRYSFRGLYTLKYGKLAFHVVNSNIAIDSLPTLQISLGIVAFFERFMMKTLFLPSSQISGRMYNVMWKVCRSPTLCRYLETIIDFKW
jgi:hypothetical protein